MTTAKNLGIWMDHSNAHLMEFTTGDIETKTIGSTSIHPQQEQGTDKSENVTHNKEQQQQSSYYKKLGDAIKNYDDVILFGPTNAKAELFNILRADHHFEKIKIEVKPADKMTENQQHAFVKAYFSKS